MARLAEALSCSIPDPVRAKADPNDSVLTICIAKHT